MVRTGDQGLVEVTVHPVSAPAPQIAGLASDIALLGKNETELEYDALTYVEIIGKVAGSGDKLNELQTLPLQGDIGASPLGDCAAAY